MLRMEPEVDGTDHGALASFTGHDGLSLSCGITGPSLVSDEVVTDNGAFAESELWREGESDPQDAAHDLSSSLFNKLTISDLAKKINELLLQLPKLARGRKHNKADYILVLQEHEMSLMNTILQLMTACTGVTMTRSHADCE